MMATELLAAHQAGRLRATLARASDFFGPEALGSMMGERVLPKVLAGRKVSLLGALDTPHHMGYMPDVAMTLVAIATDERAWGKAWHVPNDAPRTQRQMIEALAVAAATSVKVGSLPSGVVRTLGTLVPMLRELRETRYQFDQPWIVDSSLTEQTFGLAATPFDVAINETVGWWRTRLAG
jgi:dTDP-D-glucose 4,6-dehydratase